MSCGQKQRSAAIMTGTSSHRCAGFWRGVLCTTAGPQKSCFGLVYIIVLLSIKVARYQLGRCLSTVLAMPICCIHLCRKVHLCCPFSRTCQTRDGTWFEVRLDAQLPGTVLLRSEKDGSIYFITLNITQVSRGRGGAGERQEGTGAGQGNWHCAKPVTGDRRQAGKSRTRGLSWACKGAAAIDARKR